eukprot:TRINITY_DN34415_c0_g1_i1.p1 TRINITY_DN34415_c0_g1~~TRINITY_DN34415_c0_g1_i1.p1  ORF type:complete len:527 (+),score=90.87 TRINITY_DN34415_c0_g1_i1:201-1781(+)
MEGLMSVVKTGMREVSGFIGDGKPGAAKCSGYLPKRDTHDKPSRSATSESTTAARPSCQFGAKCYRRNLQHLQEFVHPGDRDYRLGLVYFPKRKGQAIKPEFPTMRVLFNYCDPDESGNISAAEFKEAWNHLTKLPAEMFREDTDGSFNCTFEEAWNSAAGEGTHLTFAQFARWAHGEGLVLPVGVDLGHGGERKCNFQYKGGSRCPCATFEEGSHPSMCTCGHKSSVHLSDAATLTFEEQQVLTRLKDKGGVGTAAPERKPYFSMVVKKPVLDQLRQMLIMTHKETDNWTRDRGCALHGRNGCSNDCVMKHRAPVPLGYELIRAERNQNMALWQTYLTTRAAIAEECQRGAPELLKPLSCMDVPGEEPLDPSINEWRAFHSTSLEAAKNICNSNFRLKLAGSGATWKDAGAKAGTPLYGFGVYLAESITKADEYATPITNGLDIDIGCCVAIVCRVVGGDTRIVDTNEFDVEELRKEVFDGPHHSVFGDRVRKLKKPFREIVVYDSACVFPEYLLYYKRIGVPKD